MHVVDTKRKTISQQREKSLGQPNTYDSVVSIMSFDVKFFAESVHKIIRILTDCLETHSTAGTYNQNNLNTTRMNFFYFYEIIYYLTRVNGRKPNFTFRKTCVSVHINVHSTKGKTSYKL